MKKNLSVSLLCAIFSLCSCAAQTAAGTAPVITASVSEEETILITESSNNKTEMSEESPISEAAIKNNEEDEREKAVDSASDIFKNDTVVEDVELTDYIFDQEDIVDYAERYGLEFSFPEQEEIFNTAMTFAYQYAWARGISEFDYTDRSRYGTFTVNGEPMTGWLTGCSYKSYERFLKSVFTEGGAPQNNLYPYYGKKDELFLLDGEKGGSEYINDYAIVYEDESFIVIRDRAMSVEMEREYDYFSVLRLTDRGWRVVLLEAPNL